MKDGKNLLNSLEQIKNDLNDLQKKLKTEKVYGKEKHGLVTTVVNGEGQIVDFKFDNGMVDKEFKVAIIQSINDGLKKAEQLRKEKKQEIVGEIGIPDIPGIYWLITKEIIKGSIYLPNHSQKYSFWLLIIKQGEGKYIDQIKANKSTWRPEHSHKIN